MLSTALANFFRGRGENTLDEAVSAHKNHRTCPFGKPDFNVWKKKEKPNLKWPHNGLYKNSSRLRASSLSSYTKVGAGSNP
ncbi:MAG: hypothetical protein A2W95_07020 [Bacteroidetes bacterium GWA2_40_14]|nr:MAG: hypothetical protein A2W95_07020 [Bacteroidetes bacterium GWA2_40_14]